MKRWADSEIRYKYLEALCPESAGELWIQIQYHHLGFAMQSKHIVHEKLGILVSIDLLGTWNKVNHLGETIHKDSDGYIPS